MNATDQRILETALWPRNDRYRVSAELGLGIVGYHQRLVQLMNDPVAEKEQPARIHQLQRIRDQRRARR